MAGSCEGPRVTNEVCWNCGEHFAGAGVVIMVDFPAPTVKKVQAVRLCACCEAGAHEVNVFVAPVVDYATG